MNFFFSFTSRDRFKLKDHINISYVLPAYEIQSAYYKRNSGSFPIDKSGLLPLVDAGVTRPFYADVCPMCQGRTDYFKWEHLDPSSQLSPAYEVTWAHTYEPFYITLRSSMPRYDERFTQYGFNRVSQICEMYVAGHSFYVLNEGFILHVGFKSKDSFHSTKNSEHLSNYYVYEGFMARLSRRYLHSNKTCLDDGIS